MVLGLAIDHREAGLEAAFGHVDGLAKPSLAVLGGDSKVQSCMRFDMIIPLSPNTAKQGISRFVVTAPVKNRDRLTEPAFLAVI